MNINPSVFKRARLRDTAARWLITAGGLLIIVSVLTILVMIFKVAIPLFASPSLDRIAEGALPAQTPAESVLAIGTDDHNETFFLIGRDGLARFLAAGSMQEIKNIDLRPEGGDSLELIAAKMSGSNLYTLLWSDGSTSLLEVTFNPVFDADSVRTIESSIKRLAEFAPAPDAPEPSCVMARVSENGEVKTRVILTAADGLAVDQAIEEEDFLGNVTSENRHAVIHDKLPGQISAMALDLYGQYLYVGTENGFILYWDLSEPGNPRMAEQVKAFTDGRAITAMGMVLGEVSLAVGDAHGGLTTWFPAPAEEGGSHRALKLIHRLTSHEAAVTVIKPSRRNKTILSIDADGALAFDHMTSERRLIELDRSIPVMDASFNVRADGVSALSDDGRLHLWRFNNPHPEISWRTLFGKVWYEKYPEPAYVWQSSAASDDFEPKLSLMPLIFGTLKGTLYAMLLAVPLSCLGALYASQFMDSRLRRFVKPTVEVMAAVPSVVIGFLAALWLAPLVKGYFVSVLLFFAAGPAVIVAMLLYYHRRQKRHGTPLPAIGYEFLLLLPVLAVVFYLCSAISPPIERALFEGNITQWFWDTFKIRYDQRNCIIIGFGLGFAVIPIIFTIADDALNNVPRSLVAGSLALGASRWQTAWRVVLPSASPGIFAAIMIGFGRAIGETMIVLMATGNTPIMEWSIFNGMRTLSANIAVEIPEAPVDGTLYRVLFLTAVLLFVSTFVINTLAEVVRIRLRRKYGRL